MRRQVAPVAFVCLVSFLIGTAPARAVSADRLIVPGRGVGKLRLGPDGVANLQRLRRSDFGDVGMSQTRQVWVSKSKRHDTLYLHTVSNGALDVHPIRGVTIDRVRVSSPWFHTRGGLSVGSTLAQARRRYPDLRREPQRDVTGATVLYDVPRKGIAFEFRQAAPTAHCIGITVYTPGNKPDSGGAVSQAEVTQITVRENRV
jgi:hypothetical protein